MAEADLQVVVTAVDRATRQIRGVGRSVDRLADRSRRADRGLNILGAGLRKVSGLLAGAAVGVGLVASFRAATSAASDFEKGLIGVAKTTGIEGQELEKLGATLGQLSTEIPVASSELFQLGQVAGQLGVTGSDNITKFVDTVARLGFASNLAGEEAAQALARILNVTGESIENVDRLAATVVDLGNNFATSEREIGQATNEIARSVGQFDIGADRAAAFAAALSSVGARAELSGTAIGRVFRGITGAVAQGGEQLETFARISNQTAEEFARAYEEDATTAVVSFIQGLGELDPTEQLQALEEVSLQSEDINKVILPLAGNIDILNNALERGTVAWEQNTALIEESERAFESFDAQSKTLSNSFREFLRQIGGGFLDELADSLAGLQRVFTSGGVVSAARSFGAAIGSAIETVNEFFERNATAFSAIGESIASIAESTGVLIDLITDIIGLYGRAAGEVSGVESELSVVAAVTNTIALLVAGLVDGFRLITAVVALVGAKITQFMLPPIRLVLNGLASAVGLINKDMGDALRNVAENLENAASGAEEFGNEIIESFKNGETQVQKTRDRISGVNEELEETKNKAKEAGDAIDEAGSKTVVDTDEALGPLDADLQAKFNEIPRRLRTALNEGLSFEESRQRLLQEFEGLIVALEERGRTADVELVQNLIDAEASRQSFDQILRQSRQFQEQLRADVDLIKAQEEAGQISSSDAEARILEARQATKAELEELIPLLKERNEVIDDPALESRITSLQARIVELGTESKSIFETVGDSLEGALGGALSRIGQEAESLRDVVTDIVSSILQSLQRLAAQRIATSAVSGLGGLFAAEGAYVQGFDGGGVVRGRGTSTSDSIPARLSNGEYVVRAAAVRHYGPQLLEAINRRMVAPDMFGSKRFRGLSLSTGKRFGFAEGGLATDPESGSGGRGGARGGQNVRIINQIDSQGVADAMATAAGEKVILNVVGKNPETIRRSMG